MDIIETTVPGVLIAEPRVYRDQRGFFYESYNEREFVEKTGTNTRFVQDNHSHSVKNTLRGLHYQIQQPQGKLVRVTAGEVYDVVLDIRKSSPAFGQWTANVLSDKNKRMLWIPPGCAHGFLVISNHAECLYKVTDYWAPAFERCIIWNDVKLNIAWPLHEIPVLSEKDAQGVPFAQTEVFA